VMVFWDWAPTCSRKTLSFGLGLATRSRWFRLESARSLLHQDPFPPRLAMAPMTSGRLASCRACPKMPERSG
jgi:hypothetical protein